MAVKRIFGREDIERRFETEGERQPADREHGVFPFLRRSDNEKHRRGRLQRNAKVERHCHRLHSPPPPPPRFRRHRFRARRPTLEQRIP
ncbi:hypothetical protein Ga0100230_007285 [Opitutaceae bacterium TAV3]|nr:hypothetical protein Ga0100230_007285 [Opitutaceae bacterium TAV3]